jgi:hypothetical protein
MDDLNDSGRNLIPPLAPDMVLCGPNLTDIVRSAIDAVAAGMDPDEAAHRVGQQLLSIFLSRVDRFNLDLVTLPIRFDPGRNN